jgi:glutathione S-transferase
MLALEVKGVPYTATRLSLDKNENRSPEYLSLNRRGLVPTLKTPTGAIAESLAILAYLERLRPEPPLFGRNPAETGAIWQTALDFDNTLRMPFVTVFRSIFRGQIEENADAIKDAEAFLVPEIEAIEATLSQTDYLVGGSLSAADLSLYPPFQILRRALALEAGAKACPVLAQMLSGASAVPAWEARIEAIPGYDRTYPPHWKE